MFIQKTFEDSFVEALEKVFGKWNVTKMYYSEKYYITNSEGTIMISKVENKGKRINIFLSYFTTAKEYLSRQFKNLTKLIKKDIAIYKDDKLIFYFENEKEVEKIRIK